MTIAHLHYHCWPRSDWQKAQNLRLRFLCPYVCRKNIWSTSVAGENLGIPCEIIVFFLLNYHIKEKSASHVTCNKKGTWDCSLLYARALFIIKLKSLQCINHTKMVLEKDPFTFLLFPFFLLLFSSPPFCHPLNCRQKKKKKCSLFEIQNAIIYSLCDLHSNVVNTNRVLNAFIIIRKLFSWRKRHEMRWWTPFPAIFPRNCII